LIKTHPVTGGSRKAAARFFIASDRLAPVVARAANTNDMGPMR